MGNEEPPPAAARLRVGRPKGLLTPAEFVGGLRPAAPVGPHRLTAGFALPACEIETPALTENVVALHLGGEAPVTQRLGDRTARGSLRRGAVTVIPALERTSWTLEGPVEFLHLYLPPTLVRAAADEVGAGGRSPALAAPFAAEDPLTEQILLALLKADAARDPSAGLYADALLRALTLHLLRHHATPPVRLHRPPGQLARPALARVIGFVEANLDRPVALAELAAVAGLSVFHFARVFRRTAGVTPHRYVLERRLERARRLLAEGRLPLIEVAAACGFANPSHFATTFRRLTALSPRDYRREAAAGGGR